MLIIQSWSYRQQYNFDSTILLPANLYGPHDNFDLETSHVVPALIRKFVEALQAPTISTVNARDLLGQHYLHIPASPSLESVRGLLKQADLVIALGTEMGQTDYDMYEDGFFPLLKNLIRVDIDHEQLKKSPAGAWQYEPINIKL